MRKLFLLLSLLFSGAMAAVAQSEADSVLVMGEVVDRLSERPLPLGYVHFLGVGGDTVASAVTDTGGFFDAVRLPVGTYALVVQVKGLTLYRADLVLGSNADLHISVITDSFQLRNLREVFIVAPKHLLGNQLITSYNDPHLWDFSYRSVFGGTAHYGGADAGFKPGQFYAPAKGRDDDRIWQIIWPDRVTKADTVVHNKPKR